MNFELSRTDTVTDENDSNNTVEKTVTEKFRCELTSGTFYIYQEISGVENLIIEQPWTFDSEGNRIDWTSLEQAMNWFKSQNKHIGV